VYAELRRRAASQLRGERRNHTLGPTALVHEAFLRLVGQNADFQNRAQFVAVAATMMRRILVDHARAHAAAKRPRPEFQITLDPSIPSPSPDGLEILDLDEALSELAARDARQAKIVELRYFGGLTLDEVAAVLGLSARTIKRDWTLAKAWLYQRLKPAAHRKTPA
jgi:RNA polymerase sigma factor (TIGR02999 family)